MINRILSINLYMMMGIMLILFSISIRTYIIAHRKQLFVENVVQDLILTIKLVNITGASVPFTLPEGDYVITVNSSYLITYSKTLVRFNHLLPELSTKIIYTSIDVPIFCDKPLRPGDTLLIYRVKGGVKIG